MMASELTTIVCNHMMDVVYTQSESGGGGT